MSRIMVEAFMSGSPAPGNAQLEQLLKEIERKYEDKVAITVYPERNELYEKYNLSALPALIVGELIRFIGFCPDKESVIIALKESGLE